MSAQFLTSQTPNAYNSVLIFSTHTVPPTMVIPSDFDQGGTYRTLSKTFLGPSVGWVDLPSSLFSITSFGTYTIPVGVTQITVNVAGTVIIKLPSAILPTVPAGVLPMRFGNEPITIADIGGHATTYPITIQPATVSESIMGLSSIQIAANYGTFILYPIQAIPGWDTVPQ